MPGVFDPLPLRSLEARNRIWIPAMCQYSCIAEDGIPTDWHLVHLGQFAAGGAGLIITEATAVTPEGRISRRDAGIWDDAHTAAWRPIVDFVHGQGALIGMQLAHAGRKASTYAPWGEDGHGSVPAAERGWESVAPSAIPFGRYATPRALTAEELPGIVRAFADGARRAAAAGFDLVEIHAAHGYLLHEFLSPLANAREDGYGGSLENRARLLREVVVAVRAEVGDAMPILVRYSASDWAPGGWTVEETATVAGWMRDAGADLADVSSGGLVAHQDIPVGPGYQVPFAARLREAGIPTAAVGLITESAQADAIVRDGRADAVLLGREALRDPHVALRFAHELDVADAAPGPYERAY